MLLTRKIASGKLTRRVSNFRLQTNIKLDSFELRKVSLTGGQLTAPYIIDYLIFMFSVQKKNLKKAP